MNNDLKGTAALDVVLATMREPLSGNEINVQQWT